MDLPAATSLLAQPTRARLFAELQSLRRAATTEELADALGLHVNGVRRHLERMQEGGLVDRRRSKHGPGRPRDEWSIAPAASPTGVRPVAYRDLSLWLVRACRTSPADLRRVEETGREIGRELAPDVRDDLAEGLTQVFTALGFQPAVEAEGEGHLTCTLGNCPYRDSARERPEVVCTLHKGITEGILGGIDPDAQLAHFQPQDPDRAGCVIEVVGSQRVASGANG